MDSKALAKSKRAHSLHHSKKHHPSLTSKTPKGSDTASSGKKPNSKAEKQKVPQSQGSKTLPSNWDRYEDESDLGSEDESSNRTSQVSDVIVPKSKGADYAYLISEAKAQSQSSYSAEAFTFFNDILDEFQGLGSLLSARGQHIASLSSDDNFLLDEKETNIHEASFLSLNLHCLAEQLGQTNLAERLFIEPDLLQQELCTELQTNTGAKSDEDQTAIGTETTSNEDDLSSTNANGKNERLLRFDEAGNTSGKLTSELPADSILERPLRFDAGAAEAELDMLLDSLNETKFLDSSVRKQSSHVSHAPQRSSYQSASVSKHAKEDNTSSQTVAANLDDDIDNLLNDTSSLINKKRMSPLHETKAASIAPSTISPDLNSKVLDDFGSWLDTI